VNILFALRDCVGDMLGALDRVNHKHDVPHTLAAIAALVTLPGCWGLGPHSGPFSSCRLQFAIEEAGF
jgi:hypothetical protein